MFKQCLNMEMTSEIIRPVRAWGNGAGALLPREWAGREVEIRLIDRSGEIRSEILSILDDYLAKTIGIYITGSYARGEQVKNSDVDVICITDNLDKKIKRGKYDIILISTKNLKEELERNLIPLAPMLNEAKPILNSSAIESYKNTEITRKNMKFHIDTTKSALNVINKAIDIAKAERTGLSENIAYSLILRLRGVYIVDCLKNKKTATTSELIALVKKLSGSDKAYRLYLNAKNDEKNSRESISTEEAENISDYILQRIKKQQI
jgi:predicted nucleotidyltransferase